MTFSRDGVKYAHGAVISRRVFEQPRMYVKLFAVPERIFIDYVGNHGRRPAGMASFIYLAVTR